MLSTLNFADFYKTVINHLKVKTQWCKRSCIVYYFLKRHQIKLSKVPALNKRTFFQCHQYVQLIFFKLFSENKIRMAYFKVDNGKKKANNLCISKNQSILSESSFKEKSSEYID